jgi:hypothetical protein
MQVNVFNNSNGDLDWVKPWTTLTTSMAPLPTLPRDAYLSLRRRRHVPIVKERPIPNGPSPWAIFNGIITIEAADVERTLLSNPYFIVAARVGIANALTWSADDVTITSFEKTQLNQAVLGYKIEIKGDIAAKVDNSTVGTMQEQLTTHLVKQLESAMAALGQAQILDLQGIVAALPTLLTAAVDTNPRQRNRTSSGTGFPRTVDGRPKLGYLKAVHCATVGNLTKFSIADKTFWQQKCRSIPKSAFYLKVTMGASIDYLKPVHGSSYCKMLTTSASHQWSKDDRDWIMSEPSLDDTPSWMTTLGGQELDGRAMLVQYCRTPMV